MECGCWQGACLLRQHNQREGHPPSRGRRRPRGVSRQGAPTKRAAHSPCSIPDGSSGRARCGSGGPCGSPLPSCQRCSSCWPRPLLRGGAPSRRPGPPPARLPLPRPRPASGASATPAPLARGPSCSPRRSGRTMQTWGGRKGRRRLRQLVQACSRGFDMQDAAVQHAPELACSATHVGQSRAILRAGRSTSAADGTRGGRGVATSYCRARRES